MAITVYEDRLPGLRLRPAPVAAAAADAPPAIGLPKLAIWLVAAALPWAVIIGAVRLAIAALG